MMLGGRMGSAVRSQSASLTIGLELALVGAWAAIGFGAGLRWGTYSGEAVLLVTASVLVLFLIALGNVRTSIGPQLPLAVALGLGVAAFAAVFFPAGLYGSGGFLAASRALTTIAAVSAVLWIALGLGRQRLAAAFVVIVMIGAGAAMVLASPKPLIDDWFMLQAATTGLAHGHNIYTAHWTSGIHFEASNIFVYLPGSALFLLPFHALFGDVRFGILAAMGITGLLLTRMAGPRVLGFAGCLILLYPRALFGLEQSWIDLLILCGLCVTINLVKAERFGWAVVSLAVCLTLKQTAWILLPLAVLWRPFGWRRAVMAGATALLFIAPWAIAAPHAFYEGAVHYNLSLPTRPDSLSLYVAATNHGLHPSIAMAALGTAVAIGVCAWRLPRTTAGFALSASLVMGVFNLLDKLSFYNEWSLSAGLIVLALVVQSAQQDDPASVEAVGHGLRGDTARSGWSVAHDPVPARVAQ